MPLIYITGAPGSGKSTILRELHARGYDVRGTDEHDYSHWTSRRNGEVGAPPDDYDLHEWYKQYEWTLNPEAIAKLRHEADRSRKPVYLCGVAAGLEVVMHNFDHMIVLTADAKTLEQRIMERTDNNFGKTPHELGIVLGWQDQHVPGYQKQGATVIDTSQATPSEIADRIVEMGSGWMAP